MPIVAPAQVIANAEHVPDAAKERVRQLFEARPIWSRTAFECSVDEVERANARTYVFFFTPGAKSTWLTWVGAAVCTSHNRLLPLFAYMFSRGPWRNMWVRYGFDPRVDPSSRMYDTRSCPR